jgi:2-keto-4-pentenoate hydratase
VDPRLASALQVQLAEWRGTLDAGASRVGWKLGIGDAEKIGPGPVIGHLTTATQLEPSSVYRPDGVRTLHADAEVALELGQDVAPKSDRDRARQAIVGFGPALELVDLGGSSDDAQRIVATNVFHRAFALGPLDRPLPAEGVEGRLTVNGHVRASATSSQDFGEVVRSVATLLGALGERLQAGDRLITGSVVQVPIDPGDEVVADLGALGQVALTVGA